MATIEEDLYDDDFYENQPHEDCPKCSRHYDDIDYDYQICSKCGWEVEKEIFGKRREPTDDDFMAGEADLLTGRWL